MLSNSKVLLKYIQFTIETKCPFSKFIYTLVSEVFSTNKQLLVLFAFVLMTNLWNCFSKLFCHFLAPGDPLQVSIVTVYNTLPKNNSTFNNFLGLVHVKVVMPID